MSKFKIINVNNTMLYANEYGYIHSATAIRYGFDSDLIIRWRNNSLDITWELDKHKIDRNGIHYRGIGEFCVVDINEDCISDS